MKRIVVVFFVLFGLVFALPADTIGENFQEGGLVLGGSASFYSNFQAPSWNAWISPWMQVLVSDGVAPGVGAFAFLRSDGYRQFQVTPSLSFAFGYDADARTGPAHQLYLGSSLGVAGYDTLSFYGFSVTPSYRFSYFLAPRIAPYISVSAITLRLYQGLQFDTFLNLSVGVSFFVPNADRELAAIGD